MLTLERGYRTHIGISKMLPYVTYQLLHMQLTMLTNYKCKILLSLDNKFMWYDCISEKYLSDTMPS